MALAEKRTAARTLYLTGKYEMKEIATMLGVAYGTLAKWNREEGWEEEYSRETKVINDSEAYIRELIHYNLIILRTRAREGLKRVESGEVSADLLELIGGKEVDGLSKLFAQIKRKELDFADKVLTISDFVAFVSNKFADQSEAVMKLTDAYIEYVSYKK